MTKSACMICGKEPPFDFQITRERDKEQDPDRKELEIHIKRTHSLDEIMKHANPSEYNKRKKAKGEKKGKGEEQEQQEQEGEEALKTDDVVAELFKETPAAGTRSRSTTRGSRSRRSRTKESAVVEEAPDASSSDL